jgi:hypothetical protein
VLHPNTPTTWTIGNMYRITWKGFRGNAVTIELFDGESSVLTIVRSTTNDGVFYWGVPIEAPLGENYMIKITSTTYREDTDLSDEPFRIVEPPLPPEM